MFYTAHMLHCWTLMKLCEMLLVFSQQLIYNPETTVFPSPQYQQQQTTAKSNSNTQTLERQYMRGTNIVCPSGVVAHRFWNSNTKRLCPTQLIHKYWWSKIHRGMREKKHTKNVTRIESHSTAFTTYGAPIQTEYILALYVVDYMPVCCYILCILVSNTNHWLRGRARKRERVIEREKWRKRPEK